MSANDIELAILAAAAATLRRRAQRQARIAQDGTSIGYRGAIRGGDEFERIQFAVAQTNRLALDLERAFTKEFEGEAST